MGETGNRVVEFYASHPISAGHILARLKTERGSLEGVAAADLYPHDQDHYGGLAANAALADAAGISPGAKVADFCAGIGGPARWMAAERGAAVTGVELTPERVAGARELTALVGLSERVRVLEGDVTAAPLADGSFDAVYSQEAFLHVPDTSAVLAEACRVLRPGGRLAFTDWVANTPLSEADADAMLQGLRAQRLNSPAEYRRLLADAGFEVLAVDDLTEPWGEILKRRLEMYLQLREDTAETGSASGDDAFYHGYVRFVALVREGVLGGARFTARRAG